MKAFATKEVIIALLLVLLGGTGGGTLIGSGINAEKTIGKQDLDEMKRDIKGFVQDQTETIQQVLTLKINSLDGRLSRVEAGQDKLKDDVHNLELEAARIRGR